MSAQPSILVVDDESGILQTLQILLKNEGFDVTTAQGARRGSRPSRRMRPTSCSPTSGCPR